MTDEHCVAEVTQINSTEKVEREIIHPEIMFDAPGDEALKKYKTKRTAVHQWLNQRFPMLSHGTDDRARVWISRKKNTDQRWPKDRPPYLKFILQKQGKTVQQVLGEISFQTRINRQLMNFAGNKDKRGITTQWITIKKTRADKIHNAVGKMQYVESGNYEYVNDTEKLYLGCSKGNSFMVAIRDLKGDEKHINSSLESLKEHGFINYFGSQRFGVSSVGTHELGKYVLQKKFGMVCALLLSKQPGMKDTVQERMDEFWTTGDVTKIPKYNIQMGFHVANF
eukprot:UN06541